MWHVWGQEMGKRPSGIPKYRWEDTIRMDLQEVGCGAWSGVMWLRIGTGGAIVHAVMNLRYPYSARNIFTRRGPVSF
jgi:hypothetical protein